MSESLIFDLTPIQEPVKIGGADYVLREASGEASTKYENAKLERIKLSDGKVVNLGGMASTEVLLVSLCLFDLNNKNVPIPTIEAWPSRIKKALFDRAKEISRIDPEDNSLDHLKARRDELDKKISELEAGKGKPSESMEDGSV